MLDFQDAIGQGLAWATLAVFVGGVLTTLTPCVYPLIPITVSIFGARKASSRWQAAALSGTYVLGIAAMYSVLGVGAALTGAAFGSVLANPVVVVGIALFLAAMASSMFGAFDLALPSSLQVRLQRVSGPGYLGALGMGLIAGVIAAPCTGPVLAGVLTFIAATRDALVGFWLMFVFALGMGSLFFVLGTFSISMPKSGAWTDSVKSVFGIVLLAAALYFLKDVLPALKTLARDTPAHLAAFCALAAAGLALGAVHKSFHGAPAERVRKGVAVALAVAGIYGLSTALLVGGSEAEIAWVKSEPDGLRLAKESGRPAFIDFTADWCVACKELEHKTYPDPRVRAELDRFVPIQVDGTRNSAELERLQDKYEVVGFPTVILIDSKGQLVKELGFAGFKKPDELLEILKKVP